jgi:plastocyanin
VTSTPAGGPLNSGGIANPVGDKETYFHLFETAGTFDYFCEFHNGMVGTVRVT